jgi:hypothetical protein
VAFFAFQFFNDLLEILLFSDITGTDGNDRTASLAFMCGRVFLDSSLEDFHATASDVDFGTIGSESLRSHQANSGLSLY